VANLRAICDELLKDRHTLEVIDLRETPALAGERHILAVPTLIRERPPPPVRLIGDLSERKRVLAALDLEPA
jgi:circadian clock protein KaiB